MLDQLGQWGIIQDGEVRSVFLHGIDKCAFVDPVAGNDALQVFFIQKAMFQTIQCIISNIMDAMEGIGVE